MTYRVVGVAALEQKMADFSIKNHYSIQARSISAYNNSFELLVKDLKQYKKIEDEWAAALKEIPPKKVTVDVEIVYSGSDIRPNKFNVIYTNDGKRLSRVHENRFKE